MTGGHRMERTIGAFVLGSLLVASAPGLAGAQARGYVGFGGGVSIPVGDASNFVKLGWVAQVMGGITGPTGVIGGRVSGTFAQYKEKASTDNFRILGAMGDVVLSPQVKGKAGPYILAGAGFQNGKSSSEASGETKFAWNAGAGLAIKAGKVSVYVEGRFLSINTPGTKTNQIPITVGIRIGGH